MHAEVNTPPAAGGHQAPRSRRADAGDRAQLQREPQHDFEIGQRVEMAAKLKYVSLPNLYYLMEGLTFNVPNCAGVLDSTLIEFNKQTGIPDKIYNWNRRSSAARGRLVFPERGRIIADITEVYSREKGIIHLAKIMEAKIDGEPSPAAFFSTQSLALDIPMRVEVPLRAVIKGGESLRGSYVVYLHALLTEGKEDFVYYGITKRGWSKRFNEHVADAVQNKSRRLFSQKLSELIDARVDELKGAVANAPKLAGIVTAICAVGLNEDAAMDTEEYLVEKYSLSSKHSKGLNMIPGGREGIRSLRKLSLGRTGSLVETEDREAILDKYLQEHPLLGRPNPGVAEKWNDPEYAEAVICARENHLSADQVREIRYLAALGGNVDQIREKVAARDNAQVTRVLAGRTYARIH